MHVNTTQISSRKNPPHTQGFITAVSTVLDFCLADKELLLLIVEGSEDSV
jgi:hypothetical protein